MLTLLKQKRRAIAGKKRINKNVCLPAELFINSYLGTKTNKKISIDKLKNLKAVGVNDGPLAAGVCNFNAQWSL